MVKKCMWVIIILVLLVLFFPKSAGFSKTDAFCVGYKHGFSLGLDAGKEYLCFGIPYSTKERFHNPDCINDTDCAQLSDNAVCIQQTCQLTKIK